MSDEPINDPGWLGGVTVVDIEDLRVSRGLTRRPASTCKHARMSYDPTERRIWCRDCETDVDAFDAFTLIVERFDRHAKALQKREAKVEEAEVSALRSLAAREIDKAWRSRSMVPACPHCRNGLFPEDFKNGVKSMLGKDYARARISAQQKPRHD